MKTQLLIILIHLFAFYSSGYAQKVSYKAGPVIPSDVADNYDLLGIYKGHAYYFKSKLINEGNFYFLIKLDMNSLAIVEEFDLVKAGYKVNKERTGFFGGSLVLFYMEKEKSGDQYEYEIEGLVFDLEKEFADYRSVILPAIKQKSEPYWGVSESESKYTLYTDAYTKYYDKSLKEIGTAESLKIEKLTDLPENLQPKGFDFFDLFSSATAGRNYFYPLGKLPNVYVKSQFKPDERCYSKSRTKGHYTSISVTFYDPETKTYKRNYDVTVKPGKFLINYDCHVMHDKSVVILGVYQEGSAKSKSIKLGMFSVVLDSTLDEVSPIRYSEASEISMDEIHDHPFANRYIFKDQLIMYDAFWINSKEDYLFRYEFSGYAYLEEFDVIRVNKKTGEIKLDKLQNKIHGGLVILGFNDYTVYRLTDTSAIFFFNDHPKNMGLKSDDPKIRENDMYPKSSNFSYIYYSSEYGFQSRKVVLTGAQEKFMLDNYKYLTVVVKNEDGSTSIILMSVDANSKNRRFYKFTFSME